jgi:hypothetical protein
MLRYVTVVKMIAYLLQRFRKGSLNLPAEETEFNKD